MAKILFGGSASDFVVAPVTVPTSAGGTVDVLKLNPGASLEAWSAGTAGSQVTDLLLFTGSYTTPGAAAPSGIFPAETSSTFLVWAEDTLDALYVTGQGAGVSGGQRWIVRPINDLARLRALEALAPIPSAQKGAASGVAPLGADSKVPSTYLPSSVASGVIDITTSGGGTESGNVTLTAADLAAVPTSRLISPGTALTGGGDLTANRTLSVVLGTSAGQAAEGNHTHGGFTTSPRPVFVQILSNDAPTEWKTAAAADPYTLVCDGTADDVQWQAAAELCPPLQSRNAGMPAGAKQVSKIVGSGGRFNFATGVSLHTATHAMGSGYGTEIRAVSCNSTGLFRLSAVTDHLVRVSDMYLNGNGSGGGTCSGIDFDMSSGSDTSGYPSTNPDAYHLISDIYLSQFTSAAGRNGIKLWATGTANNRGNLIDRIQGRDFTGNGIELNGASDTKVMNSHIGGANVGYMISGGNCTVNHSKSFYSNNVGFWFTSGRCNVAACDSQDDDTGFFFDGSPQTATGITADSPNVAGIRVSTSDMVLTGFSIFSRGGPGSSIRFPVSQRGLWYDGTYSRSTILGNVKPSTGITTTVSGTAPSGNVNVVTT